MATSARLRVALAAIHDGAHSIFEHELSTVRRLEEAGLVSRDERTLTLTAAGEAELTAPPPSNDPTAERRARRIRCERRA